MEKFLRLVSVRSCDRVRQNDCSVVVLNMLFAQVGIYLDSPEIIHDFIKTRLAEFGIDDGADAQVTKDMVEAIVMHFAPEWSFELYHYTTLPWDESRGVPRVELEELNSGAAKKSEYRLCLKNTYNPKTKTYGAGHYVLIDTNYATSKDIMCALKKKEFEETLLGTEMCVACNIQIAEFECGNQCGTQYCGERCAKMDWNKTHALECVKKNEAFH